MVNSDGDYSEEEADVKSQNTTSKRPNSKIRYNNPLNFLNKKMNPVKDFSDIDVIVPDIRKITIQSSKSKLS